MKRMILLILFFALFLGGCTAFPAKPTATITPAAPIPTLTVVPTETLSPSSTPTTVPAATATAETLPGPTLTFSSAESVGLPALTSGQPVTITQITMVDLTHGWAIGHQAESGDRILITTDGGQTWAERTPAEPALVTAEESKSAWSYFADQQSAWVLYAAERLPVRAPVVWRTQDGGISWQASAPLPITGDEAWFIPEGFAFTDEDHGWLLVHVGAGMSHDYSDLFFTADGGQTWERLVDPYGSGLQSLENTGIAFADVQFGWVTKDNLAVMPGTFLEQSRDGGHTWEDIFLPAPPEFDWANEISQCATSSPIFLEPETGLVLVNCRTFGEQSYTYTYRTPDRGQTWQPAPLTTAAQSLVFINPQIGWALGRNIYQSSDGGLSWVFIKSVHWDGQFTFVDAQNGWAVAQDGAQIALVFSPDGGQTWQLLEPIME